ncbi:hypothetical protein [Sphingomonas mollis]|uniref:Uncharacterized protein n=1 Tax=Sphingomonas mollis TaxID=2795726 RepID=A0ABS0XTV0_9SPHN|nr:hypothetical protein [Sphingomonas sp. BT553]MBJ6123452.1 hypothetical protein [Sphingomonas sp. BT553]
MGRLVMYRDELHEHDPFRAATSAPGRAALLLVESLIHELVAVGILPLSRAIAVVDIAIDTASEIASAQVEGQRDDDRVGQLLQAIAQTLSLDAGDQTAVGDN